MRKSSLVRAPQRAAQEPRVAACRPSASSRGDRSRRARLRRLARRTHAGAAPTGGRHRTKVCWKRSRHKPAERATGAPALTGSADQLRWGAGSSRRAAGSCGAGSGDCGPRVRPRSSLPTWSGHAALSTAQVTRQRRFFHRRGRGPGTGRACGAAVAGKAPGPSLWCSPAARAWMVRLGTARGLLVVLLLLFLGLATLFDESLGLGRDHRLDLVHHA